METTTDNNYVVWTSPDEAWIVTLEIWKNIGWYGGKSENLGSARKEFMKAINANNWPEFVNAIDQFVTSYRARPKADRQYAGTLINYIRDRKWQTEAAPAAEFKPLLSTMTASCQPCKPRIAWDWDLFQAADGYIKSMLIVCAGGFRPHHEPPIRTEDEEKKWQQYLYADDAELADIYADFETQVNTLRANLTNTQ